MPTILFVRVLSLLCLLFGISCSASKKTNAQGSCAVVTLIQAHQEPWTAGHRSGGLGADFQIIIRIQPEKAYDWESLETGNKHLQIRRSEVSGDTCTLYASWLSNTDKEYQTQGKPDFSSGILHYQYQSRKYNLVIPAYHIIQSPPRP
jgi:hypothetical protein